MSPLLPLLLSFALRLSVDAAETATVPRTLRPSDACPAAHEGAETIVRSFLSNARLPVVRERYNLGTASSEDVQLLTTSRDRGTCDALWAAIRGNRTDLSPSDQVSFLRSGNMLFVSIDRSRRNARPGVTLLDGNSSLDVYDADYQLIVRVAA